MFNLNQVVNNGWGNGAIHIDTYMYIHIIGSDLQSVWAWHVVFWISQLCHNCHFCVKLLLWSMLQKSMLVGMGKRVIKLTIMLTLRGFCIMLEPRGALEVEAGKHGCPVFSQCRTRVTQQCACFLVDMDPHCTACCSIETKDKE